MSCVTRACAVCSAWCFLLDKWIKHVPGSPRGQKLPQLVCNLDFVGVGSSPGKRHKRFSLPFIFGCFSFLFFFFCVPYYFCISSICLLDPVRKKIEQTRQLWDHLHQKWSLIFRPRLKVASTTYLDPGLLLYFRYEYFVYRYITCFFFSQMLGALFRFFSWFWRHSPAQVPEGSLA